MLARDEQKVSLWVCVSIAALYKPAFIDNVEIADMIWNGFRGIILLGLITVFFSVIRIGKIKKYILAVLIWSLSLLIFTILNSGSLVNYILSVGIGLGIIISAETEIERNPYRYIHSAAVMLGWYIIINFVTIILFPDGFYLVDNYTEVNGVMMIRDQVPCYFLGFRNVMFTTIFPGIILNLIDYNIVGKKMNLFPMISTICGFLSFGILWSATSISVSVVLLFVYLLGKRIDSKTLVNTIYIITFLFFVFIVVLRFQEMFSFIIVDILKKDLTFTNRTQIWDKTIEMIKASPIFGYGYRDHQFYIDLIGASHAHNYYLDVWMRGGIVAFLSFVYLIKKCGTALSFGIKCKNQRLLIAMLWSMLIAFETESYISAVNLFVLIRLAMHCDKIADGPAEKEGIVKNVA